MPTKIKGEKNMKTGQAHVPRGSKNVAEKIRRITFKFPGPEFFVPIRTRAYILQMVPHDLNSKLPYLKTELFVLASTAA